VGDHPFQLAGDQGQLVTQTECGLPIMQDAEGDSTREAKGDEAAVRVEREGLGISDADQRRERLEAAGHLGGLGAEGAGVTAFGGFSRQYLVAFDQGAGRDARQADGQLHDAGDGELLICVEHGPQHELLFSTGRH
jgi:hypothetical protein